MNAPFVDPPIQTATFPFLIKVSNMTTMIDNELKNSLDLIVKTYVDSFFNDFVEDTKFRGKAFKLESLPRMVASMLRVSIYSHFPEDEFDKSFETYVYNRGLELMTERIKYIGDLLLAL